MLKSFLIQMPSQEDPPPSSQADPASGTASPPLTGHLTRTPPSLHPSLPLKAPGSVGGVAARRGAADGGGGSSVGGVAARSGAADGGGGRAALAGSHAHQQRRQGPQLLSRGIPMGMNRMQRFIVMEKETSASTF